MKRTLLDNARDDLVLAKKAYELSLNHDSFLNKAAYHVQQALELTFKFQLLKTTTEFPYKHEFNLLLRYVDDNKIKIYVHPFIRENADALDAWESKSRYNVDYLAVRALVYKGIQAAEEYINTVAESTLQVTYEQLQRLSENIPESDINRYNLDTLEKRIDYLVKTKTQEELLTLSKMLS